MFQNIEHKEKNSNVKLCKFDQVCREKYLHLQCQHVKFMILRSILNFQWQTFELYIINCKKKLKYHKSVDLYQIQLNVYNYSTTHSIT